MAKPRIELPPALAERIRHEAQKAFPRECCGLLEGLRSKGDFHVTAVHPARNLATEMDRFEMEPRDHFAAAKNARARGHCIIGCYHSHPGGRAEPSSRDVVGAGEEDFLWLIAADEELAGFVYRRGEFVGAEWVISSA